MDAINILELISNLGFPIACAVAMGYFIYKIYLNTAKEKEQILDLNAQNMEKVQARCAEREEKLYQEIALNREVNQKAIETIAHYAEKIDSIQKDIGEIKNNILTINVKMEGNNV